MDNYYIIIGYPPNSHVDDEPSYWNATLKKWVPKEKNATHFSKSVLVKPFPKGTGLIKEYENDKDINMYIPVTFNGDKKIHLIIESCNL